ncbi:MAG: chemotaxis protein CheA [candidate division KSB1 bacterium]|nr:chemotaxis protein CheA [candidate division KSB1 bacterium]
MGEEQESLDFLHEVLQDYITETAELLEQAEQDLLVLENHPTPDLLNRIFRAFHTVKGTSSFLGFERMAELTHRSEDLLNSLRHGERKATSAIVDLLLRVVDTARTLLQAIRDSGAEGDLSIDGILLELDQVLGAAEPSAAELTQGAGEAEVEDKGGAAGEHYPKVGGAEGEPQASAGEAPDRDARTGESTEGTRANPALSQTVRVNISRLDEIMDLVGELVLVRNRIQQLVHQMEIGGRREQLSGQLPVSVDQLASAAEQLQFVSSQLQDAVMRIRMLPVSNVFHRFPRLVRDLGREKGKEVRLVIEGEETELDKSVLELISDPLVHLIRNAVDHGIEPPDVRERNGKPRCGTIRLAACHEGDHIVLEVEDDGAGIDPQRLRQAAISRNLLPAEEVEKLSDREALDLIFLPGFSTANRVTDTSGRGVGMDVVKTNITRLNGQISIFSTVGKGTKFVVRLPLTLVIVPGLLVETAGQVLVLPLSSVLETARLSDHATYRVGGKSVLRLREGVIPLIDLAEVLNLRKGSVLGGYAVIVGLANRRAGIVVDSLRGQEEIVVKPLGGFLGRSKVFAGGTILGDGKVRLVLDVGEIINLAQGKGGSAGWHPRTLVENEAKALAS